MAMTVEDLHDLIRILEEHPEWRSEVKRVLLGNELLQLPEVVRESVALLQQHTQIVLQHSQALVELAEAQRRTEQRVEELAEAQRRTEQRVGELAEAQRRTEQRVEELAEAQRRTEQRVEELAEAQRRTEQRVEELAEAQRRTEQRVEELAEAQNQLVSAVRRLESSVERLVDWQRGEAGRREGEQYEQQTVRRAPNLFFGGEGGSPAEPHIRSLLGRWLAPFYQQLRVPEPPADPLLADIIWWKGDRVLLVEVSQKVNGQDVRRARQRANTLREVGINVTPVVMGEEWATPDSQALAQEEGVEWMVGGGVSQGFLQFRQLPSEAMQEQ